jgi:hypothetical protein
MCIQIENTSTLSVPAMPANSFEVNTALLSNCGTQENDPLPAILPAVYNSPSNAQMKFLVGVANDGDLPLIMSVTSSSLAYATLVPGSQFYVPGRSVRNWVMQLDQAKVESLEGQGGTITLHPQFQATFPTGTSVGSVTFGYTINILPPLPNRVNTLERIPNNAWIVSMVSLAVIFVGLWIAAKSRTRILKELDTLGYDTT